LRPICAELIAGLDPAASPNDARDKLCWCWAGRRRRAAQRRARRPLDQRTRLYTCLL